MAKAFQRLLDGSDDSALLSAAFHLIVKHYEEGFDVSDLRPEERNFLLAYQAQGVIDNGGFNYLFEGNFKGDPHFALTAEAYGAIGCTEAVEVFHEALALFPGGRPPADIPERLKIYRSGSGEKRGEIDCRFWRSAAEINRCLASYVRTHREVFEGLEEAPPERPATPKRPASNSAGDAPPLGARISAAFRAVLRSLTGKGARERSLSDMLADLPHWARVAFAARCARRVLPLFATNWPDAEPKRRNAIVRAIRLAERSAKEGRALEDLKRAQVDILVTAGAALRGLYGVPSAEESPPDDGNRAVAASLVAKAAEFAVRAASSSPKESASEALQAFGFAKDAASGDPRLLRRIRRDLARLDRAAEGGWHHGTPVPVDIWKTI
jgi:hypothetical protein